MTFNSKHKLTDITFIVSGLILLFVLVIRTTKGLDLTDEMQYYGEIKGLIETGKLFSNDLYIQQLVYILFYPFFSLAHLLFGFDGLVFSGRLMMSSLSIVVYLYSYYKLVKLEVPSYMAALSALSLTFAIPYHGIFAPSYNTISQIIWIFFTIKFYDWRPNSSTSFGILTIIMFFAHPTSAIMMTLLIFIRLLMEREFRHIGKFFSVVLSGALIVAPLTLYFADFHQYLDSLTFSSGYGVGTAFFSNKSDPKALLIVYAMFGACLLFKKHFNRFGFALITFLIVAFSIKYIFTGRAGGAYTIRVVYSLSSLCAIAYFWTISNTSSAEIKSRILSNWLVVGLLTYATTLSVTSGNGIGQATGAFMVGLPLLLGLAVKTVPNEKSVCTVSALKFACGVFTLILFMVHWCRYPYREGTWWQTNHYIPSVPEFNYISTTQERATFVQRMQLEFKPITRNRRILIVSEYPGLYFVLDALPETSMLYMHSLTSLKSEESLLRGLSNKKPEIVVDIFADNDYSKENSHIKNVMKNYYVNRGLNCTTGFMIFYSVEKNNPKQLKYTVCR